MPSAFPSHQGLILPIVRLWPRAIRVLPLCVGAAMPDVVDGVDGLLRRGHLGQAWGHTLLGTVLLCLPAGLVLSSLLATVDRRWRRVGWLGAVRRFFRVAAGWSPALPMAATGLAESPAARLAKASLSIWVGAISHVLFDCISHENCRWLAPWRDDSRCFPSGWYDPWFSVPLPFYEHPYPFAPHTVVWCILTIVGAVLYFWPLRWRKRRSR